MERKATLEWAAAATNTDAAQITQQNTQNKNQRNKWTIQKNITLINEWSAPPNIRNRLEYDSVFFCFSLCFYFLLLLLSLLTFLMWLSRISESEFVFVFGCVWVHTHTHTPHTFATKLDIQYIISAILHGILFLYLTLNRHIYIHNNTIIKSVCVCARQWKLHPLNTYQIIPDQMRLVSMCYVWKKLHTTEIKWIKMRWNEMK